MAMKLHTGLQVFPSIRPTITAKGADRNTRRNSLGQENSTVFAGRKIRKSFQGNNRYWSHRIKNSKHII